MKKILHSNKVEIKDFDLKELNTLTDAMENTVAKIVSRIFNHAFTGDNTYIYFPTQWAPDSDGINGPPVTDPLTMYLRVEIEEYEEPISFEFNLRTILTQWMEDSTADGSWSDQLQVVGNALQTLVDDIKKIPVR